jgi:hypothetical protein
VGVVGIHTRDKRENQSTASTEERMNYLVFIWSDGIPAPEAMAVMQHDLPAWIDEMDGRGVRLFGRELDLPETAATVRVRDGETLVSDGPFAETKEFVAGLDLLDCADLDEAIEVAAKSPVARFHPLEIWPVTSVALGERTAAFGRGDDSAGKPYLLAMWVGGVPAATFDERAVSQEGEAWRQDLEARGLHVMGARLKDANTATTLRVRDGETVLSDEPVIETEGFIGGIDVIRCTDREQAIELAARHPVARYHAIEVRPFWSE